MKKIVLLCMMALISQSCKNILEEKIISGITADYYNTPAGLEDGVKASYEPLRSWYGSQRGFTLTVFGTDEFTKGADGDFKPVNDYETPSMISGPASTYFREAWNQLYQGINTTNAVVTRAPTVEMPEALKTIRVAEARFLRAHYYFLLVQMYGPVHLTLEETTTVITTANRTPVSQIYDVIVEDLEFAVANLPATKPAEWGRAYKPAAEHMLAKVLLTRGYLPEAAKPDDFSRAAALAESVLTNYSYLSLIPRFIDLWAMDNQTNPEVVWAVQYTTDPLTNTNTTGNPAGGAFNSGNSGHLYFIMEYDAGHPGMMRDIANGRPFKRFKPTQYTLKSFDLENDSRYHGTFKTVWYANNPNNLAPGMKIGDTALYVPTFEMSDAVRATKNYKVFNPSLVAQRSNGRYFPSLNKFIDPSRLTLAQEPGSRDFFVARLAETYLIAAEANFKLGNLEKAAEQINIVRRRAALPGKEDAMTITADQVTLDFILQERTRELLGEMVRWFDLKRTGTLVDRVKLHNPDAASNIQPFHLLRPIPQDQLDRVTNPEEFAQNEGY
ncbi:RagB/SusD family nutrient uptake outer membrane protein [Rhodocytophaga aerolata]|uniref:RagB/SusD family nutrient uptake outer membrane protein n=1 Tax=Rhodocytophaga aerolata TaxID=455078 RepID=A0ABT8R5T3_9BACT|nr:RagB/SusD family nutrient uptake outer membrane protein [Rhodocytophaga aerolata]MDO1447442.1 RagB/SusD family nutrient uptake outer membrane protein [Rhodocytophaga aerolata]